MADAVQYGLSNVHYAVYNEDDGTYETPVHVPGAVSLTIDPEGDSAEFYADNRKYFTDEKNNGYTASLEMAEVPDEMMTALLGLTKDETTGLMIESAADKQVPFALLFEVEGNVAARRYAYYYCKASRPNIDAATTESTIEPTTATLDLTITSVNIGDIDYVRGFASEGATSYDNWYDSVQLASA